MLNGIIVVLGSLQTVDDLWLVLGVHVQPWYGLIIVTVIPGLHTY